MHRYFARSSTATMCMTLALMTLALAAAVLGAPADASAQATAADASPTLPAGAAVPAAVPGEILVGLTQPLSGVSAAAAPLASNAEVVDAASQCGQAVSLAVLRVAPGQEAATIEQLRSNPAVRFAEPNALVYAAQTEEIAESAAAAPEPVYVINDPLYAPRQWDMQRSNFVRAWQLAGGVYTGAIRVAVIDSGVDFKHPDLARRLLPGYNYFYPSLPPVDDFGHGTHVAGTIAALTNNGLGIMGGAPAVAIDPIKLLNGYGSGSISNLIDAICRAANNGDRLINMSLEISSISPDTVTALQAAVNYARARGVMLVAAAGNSGNTSTCVPGPVYYPARLANVVAVAALTINNTRPCYGPEGPEVSLAAGGGDSTTPVLSTWPATVTVPGFITGTTNVFVPTKCAGGGRYYLLSDGSYYCGEYGTSMAAPHVVAAAALVSALKPALTADQVTAALINTARDVGLPAGQQGAGLLDAELAVRTLLTSQLVPSQPAVGQVFAPGAGPVTATVAISNPSLDPITVTGALVGAGTWFTVTNLVGPSFVGSVRYGQPQYFTVVISPTNLAEGVYTGYIIAAGTRSDGSKTAATITVRAAVGDYSHQFFLPFIPVKALPSPDVDGGFAWETSPVSPTVLALTESGSVSVNLPFSFPLPGPDASGGYLYSQANVYSDGFVLLGDKIAGPANPGQNQCLPVMTSGLQGIWGWWADLDPSAAGAEVSTFQPGSDRFVIQYLNVPTAAGVTPSYSVSFQIVLYQNGNVKLNYRDVPALIAQSLTSAVPLATIGVQARSGLFRNQVVCRTSQMAVGQLPLPHETIWVRSGEIY